MDYILKVQLFRFRPTLIKKVLQVSMCDTSVLMFNNDISPAVAEELTCITY